VQGRAWREEIPQASFVSLAFPLPPKLCTQGQVAFGVVHLGASATEADDVNSLPTTETEGTASAGEGGAFTTLTDAVKEKFELIQITEATTRAAAKLSDEEGPSVAN
jgi:hypothetical protein